MCPEGRGRGSHTGRSALACLGDRQASGIHSREQVISGGDGLPAGLPGCSGKQRKADSLKTIGKEEGS